MGNLVYALPAPLCIICYFFKWDLFGLSVIGIYWSVCAKHPLINTHTPLTCHLTPPTYVTSPDITYYSNTLTTPIHSPPDVTYWVNTLTTPYIHPLMSHIVPIHSPPLCIHPLMSLSTPIHSLPHINHHHHTLTTWHHSLPDTHTHTHTHRRTDIPENPSE